ncbi:hypothetical protein QT970_24925 [Microcoleus sp. herbarium8]|uniref:hypothetical protein n=1 Tax=Microcoleus sp. herbarium8 TaxID=3055436 RepID=UPI002FD755BC
MQKIGLVVWVISGNLVVSNCQTYLIEKVAQFHVERDAPAQSDFEKNLKRDLTAYFTELEGEGITVSYEYLREGPTQVGVANPKYYLWVSVYRHQQLIDVGAVRIAAIQESSYFLVLHYFSKSQIRENPEQIDLVFPNSVSVKIRQLMK